MRSFVILSGIALLCVGCVTEQPHYSKPPSFAAVEGRATATRSHLHQASEATRAITVYAQEKKDETLQKLTETVAAALQKANENNEALIKELATVKAQTVTVTKERDDWRAYGEKEHEIRLLQAKKYKRLKGPACAVGAALVGLIIWKLKALLLFIPPPYNFVAMAAMPLGVFGLLWAVL